MRAGGAGIALSRRRVGGSGATLPLVVGIDAAGQGRGLQGPLQLGLGGYKGLAPLGDPILSGALVFPDQEIQLVEVPKAEAETRLDESRASRPG